MLAAEPDNVGAHGNLAVVYMRRKDWKSALDELHAAERLAPKMPGIRLNIGLVYYRQADYQHAIAPFESVVHDQPDSGRRAICSVSATSSRNDMRMPPRRSSRYGRRSRPT